MDSRLAIDSAVLLLYFVLIVSIGLYMGRKEENTRCMGFGLTRHKISDCARERVWLQVGRSNFSKATHQNEAQFAA
jgi:hypothetical protein